MPGDDFDNWWRQNIVPEQSVASREFSRIVWAAAIQKAVETVERHKLLFRGDGPQSHLAAFVRELAGK
jgi:hypothetical protein